MINGWTKERMSSTIAKRVPEGGAVSAGCCQYRLDADEPKSQCCSAGAFIPDDIWPDLVVVEPVGTWDDLVRDNPEAGLEKVAPLEVAGMLEMQHVHDKLALRGGPARDGVLAWIFVEVEE